MNYFNMQKYKYNLLLFNMLLLILIKMVYPLSLNINNFLYNIIKNYNHIYDKKNLLFQHNLFINFIK